MYRIGAQQGSYGKVNGSAQAWSAATVQHFDPQLWVDAADVQSDGNLASWPAKAGTAPTQATESKKPEGDRDGWATDGGPAVKFDGVGECVQTSTPDLNGKQQYTIAATFKAGSNAAHRIVAEYNTNWAAANGCALQQANATGVVLGSQGDGTNYRYSTGGSDTSSTEICAIITSDRGTSGSSMGEAYVNGSNVSDFDATSGADPAGNFGSSTWNIGSRNDGAARPLDGAIRELAIYSTGVWSAAAVGAVDTALRFRAGLL
jgi:hypothetical protein